jgi:alpha-tubulin suppressor-like RCC1 family protein
MAHSVPPPRCPACYFSPAAASEPRPAHTCGLRVPGPASPPVISRKGTKVSISGMSAPSRPPSIEASANRFTAELSGMMNEPWLIRQHLFDLHYTPTCIAAGADFSFFLSTSGQLFATGNNTKGQLGLGDIQDVVSFTLVTLPEGATRVVSIAAGGYHTFILTESGQVFAAGDNSNGQLGLEDTRITNNFTFVTLPEWATRVVAIVAGIYHSLLLTKSGQVLFAGMNSEGHFGIEDTTRTNNYFTLVTLPEGATPVVAIDASFYHSLLLTESGQVLGMGINNYGLLGLGDIQNVLSFTFVPLPKGATRVVAIDAGIYHSLLLTESGQVLFAGKNTKNQLDLGDIQITNNFTFVLLPKGIHVMAIVTGESHSLLLTKSGQVLGMGKNDDGQLGLGDIQNVLSFTFVPLPKGIRVMAIVAGLRHSLLLTERGQLFVAGRNDYGQLGLRHKTNKNLFTSRQCVVCGSMETQLLSSETHYRCRSGHVTGEPPSSEPCSSGCIIS